MPYIDYNKIENYLPSSLKTELQKEDVFNSLESAAAAIISKESGITEPDDITETPAWLIPVAAFLIIKFASGKLSHASPELLADIDKNYKWALDYMKAKQTITISEEISFCASGTAGGTTW